MILHHRVLCYSDCIEILRKEGLDPKFAVVEHYPTRVHWPQYPPGVFCYQFMLNDKENIGVYIPDLDSFQILLFDGKPRRWMLPIEHRREIH